MYSRCFCWHWNSFFFLCLWMYKDWMCCFSDLSVMVYLCFYLFCTCLRSMATKQFVIDYTLQQECLCGFDRVKWGNTGWVCVQLNVCQWTGILIRLKGRDICWVCLLYFCTTISPLLTADLFAFFLPNIQIVHDSFKKQDYEYVILVPLFSFCKIPFWRISWFIFIQWKENMLPRSKVTKRQLQEK